jgi:hypothetical protein
MTKIDYGLGISLGLILGSVLHTSNMKTQSISKHYGEFVLDLYYISAK